MKTYFDFKKKTFVIPGAAYGYIQDNILYISDEQGQEIIPIIHIKLTDYNSYYRKHWVRHDKRVFCEMRSMYISNNRTIVLHRSNYGFFPDIVMEEELLHKFVKLINNKENEIIQQK